MRVALAMDPCLLELKCANQVAARVAYVTTPFQLKQFHTSANLFGFFARRAFWLYQLERDRE